MSRFVRFFLFITFFASVMDIYATTLPWNHGDLRVAPGGRYFCHDDGTPFFWMGDTGWLLPERLDREEAAEYLAGASAAGFNVVQVQTVNDVPARNAYGCSSHPAGYDFSDVDVNGDNGYWRHMDYIVDTAADNGIYVGMVCIWGGLVKNGKMNVEEARAYGTFLARRYKDRPNIVWIIGGDIRGDVKTDVWVALAESIKAVDNRHLMSFHPFGRTSSIEWFHDAQWLDFNMFQSGHRRYDQIRGDGDDRAKASQAEDNWRYVDAAYEMSPAKPVIDAEPSYEEIPQGLHDPSEPWWKAPDVRRYAYWSVLSGAAGHTYGHSSVMQMKKDEPVGAYGAVKTWREGMLDPGYNQMKYLRRLMEMIPFHELVPDQGIIAGENGLRYDRVVAARGNGWTLAYTYTNRPFTVALDRIGGDKKIAWWYDVTSGAVEPAGEYDGARAIFQYSGAPVGAGNDRVLIITDAESALSLNPILRNCTALGNM